MISLHSYAHAVILEAPERVDVKVVEDGWIRVGLGGDNYHSIALSFRDVGVLRDFISRLQVATDDEEVRNPR